MLGRTKILRESGVLVTVNPESQQFERMKLMKSGRNAGELFGVDTVVS